MSLGSRVTESARVALKNHLTSTPREPLLFLYPQWTRKSSTSAALGRDLPATKNDQQNLSGLSEAPEGSAVPRTTISVEIGEIKSRKSNASEESLATSTVQGPLEPRPVGRRIHSGKGKILLCSLPRLKKLLGEPPLPRLVRATSKVSRRVSWDARERKVEGRAGRVLAASANWHQWTRIKSDLREYNQAVHDLNEGKDPSVEIDWRDILSDLKKYTPKHGPCINEALTIIVSEEDVNRLIYAIDGNLWDIALNCGCDVEWKEGVAKQKLRTFTASGSVVSLGMFVAELKRCAPDTGILSRKLHPGTKSTMQDGAVRPCLSRRVRRPFSRAEVSQITPPKTWTPESFFDYVQALTQYPIWYDDYTPRKPKKFQNDETILDLFQNPECASSITTAACHKALGHFIKIDKISSVRALFDQMLSEGLGKTETFNIILRATARKKHMRAFRHLLHVMVNRGIEPNARTWLAFMDMPQDNNIRVHIFNAMKEQGLFGLKSIWKGVAFGVTDHEIEISLNNNQSQEEFVAHMDALFTPDWPSKWTGARVLGALGRRGLVSRCWEFLHFLQERSVKPSHECIEIVLKRCAAQKNSEGAIEFVTNLPSSYNFQPTRDNIDSLSNGAWHTQSYNTLRVLWRYACLHGVTHKTLRWRILKNMIDSSVYRLPAINAHARFRQMVAPIVFGTSCRGMHPVQISNQNRIKMELKVNNKISDASVDRRAIQRDQIRTHVSSTQEELHEQASDAKVLSESDTSTTDVFDFEAYDAAITADTEPLSSLSHHSTARCNPHDFSIAYTGSLFPFDDVTFDLKKEIVRLPDEKDKVLANLMSLDVKVFKDWEPVEDLRVMLVKAWEMDKEWKRKEAEEQAEGKKVMTPEQLVAKRRRLTNEAIGVEVRSRHGLGTMVWK